MTLNDGNAPIYQISHPSGAPCAKLNKNKPMLSVQKDSSGSVEFSDVQIVHKFAG